MRMMIKHMISGRMLLECLKNELSVSARMIISGKSEPVRAVLVQKYITTEERNTVAAALIASLAVSVTDMLSSGTMFSLSSTEMKKAIIQIWLILILIQVWVSKDLHASCRV